MKYYKTCYEQLGGFNEVFAGSFKTMVKSGEVQYAQFLNVQDGFLHDVEDRPRNIMVPSDNLCGLLTIIQSYLWKSLKEAIP